MAEEKQTRKKAGSTVDKSVVQKSNELDALWKSSLTLGEFKILDAFLSRINSHDPETRIVTFSKEELEQKFGVDRIRIPELKIRLMHLLQPIPIDTSKGGFILTPLFDMASCEQDEKGQWQIKIRSSPAAQKYFFNIEDVGYFQYMFRRVAYIGSRYSYVLFQYLERNRFRETWTIELDELKKLLQCDKDAVYDDFKYFKKFILTKCQNELAEKAEMVFTYKLIRTGRTVTAIEFTVEPNAPGQLEPKRFMSADDIQADFSNAGKADNISIRENLCKGFSDPVFDDLTYSELEILKSLIESEIGDGKSDGDTEKQLSSYLKAKLLIAKDRKPEKLFAYVKKIVENDIEETRKTGKESGGKKEPSRSFDPDDFFEAALRRSYGGNVPKGATGDKKDGE